MCIEPYLLYENITITFSWIITIACLDHLDINEAFAKKKQKKTYMNYTKSLAHSHIDIFCWTRLPYVQSTIYKGNVNIFFLSYFTYFQLLLENNELVWHFNLWPGQTCHSEWCNGRKWHILMAVMRGNRVGGNWLTKWDEVKNFPWYTHRLMHRKRVTCELHDSYFRLMTIKHAISKIE